jgi:hypothetical protein
MEEKHGDETRESTEAIPQGPEPGYGTVGWPRIIES